MSSLYQFPVSKPVHAMKVTSPDFQVDLLENNLYINFDEVRSTDAIDGIKTTLGIIKNELTVTNDYEVILISGHRGCGKTSELKKLHSELNKPELYVSIFISIEEELELSSFSQEHLYFLLLTKLVERMEEVGISTNLGSLNKLAELLFEDHEKERKSGTSAGVEATVEKEVGIDWWGFIKLKGGVKAKLAADKTFTDTITRKIRLNLIDFVNKVNLLLVDVREAFIHKEAGQDILFIIDGSEKIPFEEYKKIFVDNAYTIKALSANVLAAVTINAWYEIQNSATGFPSNYLLPMLNTDATEYRSLMKEALEKRIDVSNLIYQDAVKEIIDHSGGCIRQMYILTNYMLNFARGEKATKEMANKAIYKEGQRLYEQLNTEHVDMLKKIKSNPNDIRYGDKIVTDLLFGLQLLKYNGLSKVNPVLQRYLDDKIK
jgi:hypothetical protein